MRRVVVLPEPDGPSIEKNSPAAMSRSTLVTATTSPYSLRTPSSRTAGIGRASPAAFVLAGCVATVTGSSGIRTRTGVA